MQLLSKPTRFRAYQLGIAGSSFSYFDGEKFYLIEAMLTDQSEASLVDELYACGKGKKIDVLHITSWDNDHCSPSALKKILSYLNPDRVEIPGYNPITDSGIESQGIINGYLNSRFMQNDPIEVIKFSPIFNRDLPPAISFEYTNVVFHPYYLTENCNNNSTVMLFRAGSFTVLSLGDVESSDIADLFMENKIFNTEVDVMILAHHGADNGFTSDRFIKVISPSVTVSISNYGSQFEHPKPEIKKILNDNNVPIYTTKTGDIVVESVEDHKSKFKVTNLKADSSDVSSESTFTTKRFQHDISPLLKYTLGYK